MALATGYSSGCAAAITFFMRSVVVNRMCLLLVGSTLVVAAGGQAALGQTLISYDFGTPGAAGAAPGNQSSTPATIITAGVTASGISRGAGLNAAAGSGSINSTGFAGSSTTPGTQADAIAGNDYYTFTVTAPAGQAFNFSSLVVNTQRTIVGPTTIQLRTSLDAFAASVGTITGLPTAATPQTFNLDGLDAASTMTTTPVEFRLYAFGDTSVSGGNGSLRLTNILTDTGVDLNGTLTPVPEPATVLATSAAGLGLVGLLRRRWYAAQL